MASLKSLKLRNDENNRQIKCLLVEDYTTGDLIKYYDPRDFSKIIESTDKMFLTKVYTPQDKDGVLDLIDKGVRDSENGVQLEVTEEDMLINMMLKFTDLEIDINDKETIKEVLENPNELFFAIKIEMEKILMSNLESFVSMYKTIQSNPQVSNILSQNVKTKEISAEEKKKLQEIEELKARLKELGE